MKANVYVTLKRSVLDPQGKVIQQALSRLGYSEVKDVRQGKYFELELETLERRKAAAQLEEMCKRLLANTVIEEYRYELIDE